MGVMRPSAPRVMLPSPSLLRARPLGAAPRAARTVGCCLVLGVLLGANACGEPKATGPSKPAVAAAAEASPARTLGEARSAFTASRYPEAERGFRRLLSDGDATPAERLDAELGLAETLLVTGRYDEAQKLALEAAQRAPAPPEGAVSDPKSSLICAAAEAQRRTGALDEALKTLDSASSTSLDALLLRGEIEILGGHRKRAESALMEIVGAYNAGRIADTDGRSLAIVGRAAHLLRSPHDANDAFDEAEQATPGYLRTLLWRADLFLDKYDLAHAGEVLDEALKIAPNHPEALVLTAQLRLAETLDFDEADRLDKKALSVDPKLSGAYFVLGGVSLRDEDPAGAEAQANGGLRFNPNDLELLSLRAASRFLRDDLAGFEAEVAAVLAKNPEYTKIFQIVGEYADWEHRYDEIVKLMRRAVRIDPEDGKARADLGLNLIRAGQDAAGVVELRRAFEADPFNVRVFNTLELYEKIIPRDYDEVDSGRFRIRYPKQERAVLERYVPELLERAYKKLSARYGFEPETPIGVELYQKRDEFAVRTSGLPQTEIQGVCFGRTLATISPGGEPANLGMTLWHELSHVFHIQMTKSHVPRWLTEGLAEHETAIERPEWKRELDPELYAALRDNRLPHLGNMTRAFTRAEDMSDIATAYYASNRIADFLDERYGMPKLDKMLFAYGAGKTTEAASLEAFGVAPTTLDTEFRGYLGKKLARFDAQFVPMKPRGTLEGLAEKAKQAQSDDKAQIAYALGLASSGEADKAKQIVDKVLAKNPQEPDALFTRARLDIVSSKVPEAKKVFDQMVAGGSDGYEVQMMLARLSRSRGDEPGTRAHLMKASELDPMNAEPLVELLKMRGTEPAQERAALSRLSGLEENAFEVHRKNLAALVEAKDYPAAVAAGEAALWSNLEDLEIHLLFARALEATGDKKRALFELESATLCPGSRKERADAFQALGEAQARLGRATDSKKSLEQAATLRAGKPDAEAGATPDAAGAPPSDSDAR